VTRFNGIPVLKKRPLLHEAPDDLHNLIRCDIERELRSAKSSIASYYNESRIRDALIPSAELCSSPV
jgi:hypothetical protein